MTGAVDGAPAGGSGPEVEARPPQGLVRVIGGLSLLTVPLAVVAAATGDVLLGLVALVSAAWAGSLAYVGATARASADAGGVAVRWMGVTEVVPWSDVVAVEVDRMGRGGVRRGALLVRRDGRAVRWTPWVPFLWFAHGAARRSVERLDELLSTVGGDLRVTDPDAPTEDRPSWTRPQR